MAKRRKSIPASERWQRDRNRTGRVLGTLPYVVKTCSDFDLDRVRWDIEEWEMYIGRAKAALEQRCADDLTREKIAGLRNMTEANGCTAAEARTAGVMADKLTARLSA